MADIDPNNFLGHNYQNHLENMYALSISRPSEYFAMRAHVKRNVKEKCVKDLYDTLYGILSTGKNASGAQVVKLKEFSNNPAEAYSPQLPKQIITEMVMSIANSVDEMLIDVLNKIMPGKFADIMSSKMKIEGLSENIQN